jgi:putative sigma-54 modulation protein
MNIQIEGRNFKITPAIQDHTHKRIDNLNKYFSGIHSLHVIMSVEEHKKPDHHVEMVCGAVKGKTLVVNAHDEDLYAAIDAAAHKLKENLKKFKEKLQSHKSPAHPASQIETEQE